MKPKKLLVIGGGPKAVALAAKAHVLRRLGGSPPEVIVFEKKEIGAHWSGSIGYTDGWRFICTPAEKDIGFPYNSIFGYEVDRAMLEFSWQAYMVHSGSFSEWVDRGGQPPLHRTFCDYLRWVATRVDMQVSLQEIKRVKVKGKRWQIERPVNESPRSVQGEGLVITGPGKPMKLPGQPSHPSIMDGMTVWRSLGKFRNIKKGKIGIIGSGEASAAIIIGLLPLVGHETEIIVMNREPVIYSRGESYGENRYFSDSLDWAQIPAAQRRELLQRTDRGVFSPSVQRMLDRAANVKHESIDVDRIRIRKGRPHVTGTYGGQLKTLDFDRLIVAISFDSVSTARILPSDIWQRLTEKDGKQVLEEKLGWDLSVENMDPKLHLPMLAAFAEGPGLPNLTCLGDLSDRILYDYCR